MPTYTLRSRKTKESHDVVCKYDELQAMLEKDPDLVHVLSTAKIVTGVGTNAKVDGGFKEVMSKIKSKYTVNNMNNY